MALEETVVEIRGKVLASGLPNEFAVSTGAVLPMLAALDWPTGDPLVVYPQFPVEGKLVDFALRNPTGWNPVVFLEVKKVGGLSPKGEKQIFDYAYTKGVPLLVFTDGREWDFYLTAGQGPYEERKIYNLDLLRCDVDEGCDRLRRYLFRGDVLKGIAAQNAWADYQGVLQQREIEAALPQAWNQLLDTVDDSVIESLVKRVTGICGYAPGRQTCADFLAQIPRMGVLPQPIPTPPKPVARPNTAPAKPKSDVGFTLRGEWYGCSNAIRVMVGVLEKLTELDPAFPDKFAAKDTRKKRQYVAKSKEGLYSEKPADFCERFSVHAKFGWFIGTNYGKGQVKDAVKLACETAGLELGRDIILHID